MSHPERTPASAVVDLRATGGIPETAAVRAVLESAADVIFSDGVSPEFLDQWTFETVQLLEARAAPHDAARPARTGVSAGRH